MNQIPDPRQPPIISPSARRVKFSFKHLQRKGKYSLKSFNALPPKVRMANCAKFREWSRLSLAEFKSANGVRYKKRRIGYKKPGELSEDVKDNLWDYFRLKGKTRVYGVMFGRVFYVIRIDPNHEI